MRIFFIGTVDFSFHALEALIANKYHIVGVATKKISEFNSDYKDLSPLCIQYNIPFKYVNDINHVNNLAFINSLEPEVIYCFGWSSLVKRPLLNLTKMGVIGFHPSLLPYNRGRHPIIWALVLGLKKTGSTFFFMDEGADTGDIISQEMIEISQNDNALTLYSKIISTATRQILDFTKQFQDGNIIRIKQLENSGNVWRKRGKKDGCIDFRMHSETINNLVRALSYPYKGAHIQILDQEIIVLASEIMGCEFNNLEPGKILGIQGNKIKVKTANGALQLTLERVPNEIQVGDYL